MWFVRVGFLKDISMTTSVNTDSFRTRFFKTPISHRIAIMSMVTQRAQWLMSTLVSSLCLCVFCVRVWMKHYFFINTRWQSRSRNNSTHLAAAFQTQSWVSAALLLFVPCAPFCCCRSAPLSAPESRTGYCPWTQKLGRTASFFWRTSELLDLIRGHHALLLDAQRFTFQGRMINSIFSINVCYIQIFLSPCDWISCC